MTTVTTHTSLVEAADRTSILTYASHLLEPGDRTPGAVLPAAAPLLQWADEADSRTDRHARQSALQRAHVNSQNRLKAARAVLGDDTAPRLTPAEFLDEARAYYRFIAQVDD